MDMRAMFAGNVIGGYLMGQQQREARLEQAKLEQQKLKIMMDAQKLKDSADERKAAAEERKAATRQKLIELELQAAGIPSLTADPSAGGSQLQFDESFGDQSTAAQSRAAAPKKQSLLDILAERPVLSQLLKEEVGTDYPAAIEAQRRAKEDAWRRQNDIINLMVRAGAGSYVDEQDRATGEVQEQRQRKGEIEKAAGAATRAVNRRQGFLPGTVVKDG